MSTRVAVTSLTAAAGAPCRPHVSHVSLAVRIQEAPRAHCGQSPTNATSRRTSLLPASARRPRHVASVPQWAPSGCVPADAGADAHAERTLALYVLSARASSLVFHLCGKDDGSSYEAKRSARLKQAVAGTLRVTVTIQQCHSPEQTARRALGLAGTVTWQPPCTCSACDRGLR